MSQFKRKLSAFTAMLALISFSGAAISVTSSDVINKTSNAEVINTSSKRTDINLKSGAGKGAVAQIDFSKFNVGEDEHVNYGFSSVSQTMINRVLGGNQSKIMGRVTNSCIAGSSCTSNAGTGKVIFINPAGVMFGQGSTVDLNSFTVSTFDFKGAKNLKNMSESELNRYQNTVLNKLSPINELNGTNKPEKDQSAAINFDSNYTQAFEDAGIDMSKLSGKTKIVLEGTHFDKFTDDTNTTVANLNTNKSTAFVSDNIDYKDSIIRTGDNFNYENFSKSFGNVRIVTADGVTFNYLHNGHNATQKVQNSAGDVTRKISIDNSGLAGNQTAIDSGTVRIVNQSNDKSNIRIKNTLIKGRKMVAGEEGKVVITGSGDVDVEHSRIDTLNTEVTVDGKTSDTYGYTGPNDQAGIAYITAGGDLNVSDSVISTAGTTAASNEAADVRLVSVNKNVNIDNVRVISDGNVGVEASGEANINNSLLQATNTVDESQTKNVLIRNASSKAVTIKDAAVDASGDVDIRSSLSSGEVSGDIKISSTKKNGQNQTLINAGNNLSIEGKNTTLDDASLAYKNIKFYGKNTSGINNVTVKNDSTFSPKDSDGSISPDVTLETNGDFTMDNATMRAAGFSLKLDRDSNGNLVDDGTADAIGYDIAITPANANNLTVTSTQGNVNVVNGSDINVNKDIKFISKTGNYNQDNSKISAGNDVNVTAEKNINITEKSNIQADSFFWGRWVRMDNGQEYEVLETKGAVSEECAYQMAKGLYELTGSDICVSTTGVAGPTGGTAEKPVGLMYSCIYTPKKSKIYRILKPSDTPRTEMKELFVEEVLKNILEFIAD